jgi:hypothetical protein
MICIGGIMFSNLLSDPANVWYWICILVKLQVSSNHLFQSLLSVLPPVQEAKDECITYFSLMPCLYYHTLVEGHGLRMSKKTVEKGWCCLRTEGTGECFNQGQSKWLEAVESCIISTACTVIGKSNQGFQDGWVMWLASETRKYT